MAFNFNVEDTKNIPGLSKPWDGDVPFLTPAFFELDVLIKYFYNPKYICEFHSETYGTIETPEDENFEYDSDFPFGINPNNKVIAWLGDINKLKSNEKLYLESHNVDSDGDIKSEFYDAQIKAEFTDPIREVELILLKTKISALTNKLYGFDLYNTTEPGVSQVIEASSKFKRIVFNSEDDLKRFLSIWNEELVEDLNVSGLKECLKKEGVEIQKGNKGNKLLEKLIKEVIGIDDNIIAPFFYLYDLRLWSDHKGMQDYYDTAIQNMGLENNVEYSIIYKRLIDFMHEFMMKLLAKLNEIDDEKTQSAYN